jgi:O-antigen ligase
VTPNILAGYLVMVIPVTLIYKYRIWLAIPLTFALFFTKSLGALTVIPVILLIYFLLDEGAKRKNALLALSGLIIAIAIIAISRFSAQKLHQNPVFSTTMRLDYWKETLKIIAYAPLKGIGPGNFNLAASRYAHNSYLQLWAETGIFGLITFLWLIGTVFSKSLKALRESTQKREIACLFCASLAFLLHNLVDFSFFLPEVSLIWWAILGLLYSFSQHPLT